MKWWPFPCRIMDFLGIEQEARNVDQSEMHRQQVLFWQDRDRRTARDNRLQHKDPVYPPGYFDNMLKPRDD